ncbi:MAG: dihydroorotase [Bacteroidetes bacterium]|nr:MAG: dihydroorotase [Bacteroidota bacterium]
MHRLFCNLKLVDPTHPLHLKQVDLRVQDGQLVEVGSALDARDAELITLDQCSVSVGWLDLEAEVGDPGQEHREDLVSLAAAATAGGYTQVGLRPNTFPAIHDKAGVSYLLQKGKTLPVTLLPIGAISRDTAGLEITEMLDMRATGAVAYSDGSHSLQHAGLLLRALLYAKSFRGLIMNQPLEKTIAGSGQIHEGLVSTSLGMRGIPSLAEELMVERDLRLLAYTDSRLHLSHISTAGAVASVRAAKAQGLHVTASVAALNLLLTVEALEDFSSNCKVLPPLRSEADRQALLAGLKDGTIDCIAANHTPREIEAKEREFTYADFGAAMLSTAFAAAATALRDELTETELIALFTSGPRRILGLPTVGLRVGEEAQFTIYHYNEQWTPERRDIFSKSKNAPLLGHNLIGRPVATVNGHHFNSLARIKASE